MWLLIRVRLTISIPWVCVHHSPPHTVWSCQLLTGHCLLTAHHWCPLVWSWPSCTPPVCVTRVTTWDHTISELEIIIAIGNFPPIGYYQMLRQIYCIFLMRKPMIVYNNVSVLLMNGQPITNPNYFKLCRIAIYIPIELSPWWGCDVEWSLIGCSTLTLTLTHQDQDIYQSPSSLSCLTSPSWRGYWYEVTPAVPWLTTLLNTHQRILQPQWGSGSPSGRQHTVWSSSVEGYPQCSSLPACECTALFVLYSNSDQLD